MLTDIRPLLTDRVSHWLAPTRDVFGKTIAADKTSHAARVVRMGGEFTLPYSREKVADAKAVIWLIDHPRAVAVGDNFELADGDVLKVARAELRTERNGSLCKVYLK